MDYPPFVEAFGRFRSFLNDEGYRNPILWVFPRDVLLVAGHWIVRPRAEALVVEEVAIAYQRAVVRRLGVKFGVLCSTEEALFCYIYCPVNRIEAQHCLMPDGLKLSVPTPPDTGRLSADADVWEAQKDYDQVQFKQWMFM